MRSDQEKVEIGLKLAKETFEIMKDSDRKKSLSDYDSFHENEFVSEEYLNNMGNEECLKNNCCFKSQSEIMGTMIQRIEKNDTELKRRRFIKLSSAVAAIFVGAIIIVSFSLSNKEKSSSNNPEMAAKSDLPIIILENGERIQLDDSKEALKINENVLVNNNTKSIVYHSEKDTSNVGKNNTLIIPQKTNYSITFSDGSRVVLNAGSSLTYPTKFTTNERRVILSGEAYFTITKSDKPFIVSSENIDIQVFGTEFNVSDYKGKSEIILVKGSIGIRNYNLDGNLKMILPNQIYLYDKNRGEEAINRIKCEDYLGWLSNSFEYEQIELSQLLDKLSVWYGIHFKYEPNDLKNIKVNICSSRDNRVSDLLAVIMKSTDLTCVRESETQYQILKTK